MAAQHAGLKKVGDYWHLALHINGQRVHESTRAKDLPTAKRVLEERRKEMLLNQCGAPKVPVLSVLVAQWLKTFKAVHSAKHWTDVESVSRLWLLPDLGSRRLDRITNPDVVQIRSKMLESGRSPVTVNDALKILKLLVNFAVKQGLLKALPFKVEFMRIQKKPRPTVAAPRIRDFLAAVDRTAKSPHIRVMLRVMVGLGMRESEVLGMRWEWFDVEHHTYVVGKAKGKEARILPVPAWLWTALHEMPKPTLSEWVFPAADANPHRSQLCRKALQRVCKDLDLGNVTQHRLRATFASIHAESGTPLSDIKELLGHKNVATTMIYVETSMESKRRAQDALGLKLGLA